jgi:hypothetical protein
MSLRSRLIIAVAIAVFVTLLALWLTSGQFDPDAGKSLFIGALIVLPLIVAANSDLTGLAATALAFVTYLVFAFLGVWFATRKKQVRPGE